MTIGEIIKKLRTEQQLTQSELGKILGVEKSTISMYENGKSRPDDAIKMKLADYFGVSVDYLLSRNVNEKEEQNEGVKILAREANDLSQEEIEILRSVIKKFKEGK